jgi:hypothetical protein
MTYMLSRVYSLNLTQAKQDKRPLVPQASQGTKQFGQRPTKSLATTITVSETNSTTPKTKV